MQSIHFPLYIYPDSVDYTTIKIVKQNGVDTNIHRDSCSGIFGIQIRIPKSKFMEVERNQTNKSFAICGGLWGGNFQTKEHYKIYGKIVQQL